jgi:hypothetical protein
MSQRMLGEVGGDEESGSEDASSDEGPDSDVETPSGKGFLAGCTPAFLMTEVLCGITVALAMVPEAVAFSLSAGLKPKVGLMTTFIISLITSLAGGRPAMASGATGSIAVLLSPILASHGKEYMFYAVILMGIFEIVLGLIGVGNLVRLVPIPVEIGFCNGLALVIAFAQLNSFKMPKESSAGRLLMAVPESFSPFVDEKPGFQVCHLFSFLSSSSYPSSLASCYQSSPSACPPHLQRLLWARPSSGVWLVPSSTPAPRSSETLDPPAGPSHPLCGLTAVSTCRR